MSLRDVKDFGWITCGSIGFIGNWSSACGSSGKRRIVRKHRETVMVLRACQEIWSMDFHARSVRDGRSALLRSLIDAHNRGGRGGEVDFSSR